MSDRYVVVADDGTVDNVVLWDGTSEWAPPEGCTARKVPDGARIEPGDRIDAQNKVTRRAPQRTREPDARSVLRLLLDKGVITEADVAAARLLSDG